MWRFSMLVLVTCFSVCLLLGCSSNTNEQSSTGGDQPQAESSEGNVGPQITSGPVASPQMMSPGSVSTVSVIANDADGDPLTYAWEATGGTIGAGNGSSAISWNAPQNIAGTQQAFVLSVTVSDGVHAASGSVSVTVTAATTLPARQRIVFQRGATDEAEIWRIDADDTDGSTLVRLVKNDGRNLTPALSADGEWVVFSSDVDGMDDVWIMDINGLHQTKLTTLGGREPNFSWDGERIVFASERDDGFEIYAMDRDGSHQVRLTAHGDDAHFPAFSPDGTKIVFERGANYDTMQILLMDADGSNVKALTNTAAGTGNWTPGFSPDGSLIAFESDRDGGESTWMMDAAGGNQVKKALPYQQNAPDFSMEGDRISFYYDGIFIMDYDRDDGSIAHARKMTDSPNLEDKFPSMGP